jgi:hypothetical protein
MNTEEQAHRYTITVEGLEGAELADDNTVEVPAATLQSYMAIVRVPPEAGKKGANPIHFGIVAQENPDIKVREKASFMQP